MARRTRMSAQARRDAILQAAVPLFAKNGFSGTTTKQLAAAANVSEALLYRHFRDKEQLYRDLQEHCAQGRGAMVQRIGRLQPCTENFVVLNYYLIGTIALGRSGPHFQNVDHQDIVRMLAHSYLDDGTFARLYLQLPRQTLMKFVAECDVAARAAGEKREEWVEPVTGMWFIQHMSFALALMQLPEDKVVVYDVPRDQLLDRLVRFAMRGWGLTDDAVARYCREEVIIDVMRRTFEDSSSETPPVASA